MAQLVTLNELRGFGAKLDERATLMEARATAVGKTVFLSHSSSDVKYLPGIISVLQNHGGSVYIDKADQRLPNSPNRKTADILRSTITGCPRFVLFVTPNSKDSKWIPWELGLADGEKGSYPIALFPAAQNRYEENWSEREYLGLYRRIVWGRMKGWDKEGWLVLDHVENSATGLREWLRGG